MQRRHKILVVDDSPINTAILEEILSEHFHLDVAASGEEALEMLATLAPDIILLDIMMPGINGYEVCRRLRADPRLRHVKVIMVSAKAMLSERLEAYEVGADDYITKPFEEEELLAKVRVFLRLKSVEELNQLKNDTLSLLGHEIRTPLNAIIAPAEALMSDKEMDNNTRRTLAELAYQGAIRLHRFLEKALMLNELRSGNAKLVLEATEIGAIISQAIAELASPAESRGVEILQLKSEMIIVTVDRDYVKRAVAAILDNAVRFSPPGAKVTVACSARDQQVHLTVTDQGEGIDPDFLPHMFEPFAGKDVLHHRGGHGLSLALAHQIVLAHEGGMNVMSSKGGGTTVEVQLPAKVAAGVRAPAMHPPSVDDSTLG